MLYDDVTIYNWTYLTSSNWKWILFKIIPFEFEELKKKAIAIRNRSDRLGDYSIESNEKSELSVYGFYSEYVVWKLLWYYDNFEIFLDRLDPTKWLDWWIDIALDNWIKIQVKYTEWFSWWKHSWDIMNQYDRSLTSDYYILVTKWDEYIDNSLRIVWRTDKEHFMIRDDKQNNHWFIKKRQRKINRCTIQSNLFDMDELEEELWIEYIMDWFKYLD